MAIVYIHKKKNTNDVFYVGIGKTEKRAYSKLGRNIHWQRIVGKYDYDIEIIHKNIDWITACDIEKTLIGEYGRNTLTNMTDGGEGICNPSTELRNKMSNSQIGKKQSLETIQKRVSKIKGIPLSSEHREKLRQSKLGSKNPMYGKTFIMNDEGREKLRKANIGKTHSEETKRKMSLAKIGKPSWNKGLSMRDETKRKMSLAKIGKPSNNKNKN